MTTFEHKRLFRPAVPINHGTRGYQGNQGGEPVSLTTAVQAAVAEVDEGSLRRVARSDAGLAFQPRTILAMVTYCYARGVYGSEEIEDLMRRDAGFRQLCQNEFPDTRVIRRFRRGNRAAIHACLTQMLQFLHEQKLAEGATVMLNDTQIAEEADRRITKAMFMDLDSEE